MGSSRRLELGIDLTNHTIALGVEVELHGWGGGGVFGIWHLILGGVVCGGIGGFLQAPSASATDGVVQHAC